jgi:hypothetical protein
MNYGNLCLDCSLRKEWDRSQLLQYVYNLSVLHFNFLFSYPSLCPPLHFLLLSSLTLPNVASTTLSVLLSSLNSFGLLVLLTDCQLWVNKLCCELWHCCVYLTTAGENDSHLIMVQKCLYMFLINFLSYSSCHCFLNSLYFFSLLF